jgi:transposase
LSSPFGVFFEGVAFKENPEGGVKCHQQCCETLQINKNDLSCKTAPQNIKLTIIEAKEINTDVKNPICWRLLTTINVENLETALNCITWYTCRWVIEEVFRILKKEGFNIEESELTYAKSIRKLSLLMM